MACDRVPGASSDARYQSANLCPAGWTARIGAHPHRPPDHRPVDQQLDCLVRDLSRRKRPVATGSQPRGLAFDIADLQQARGWAVVHDRRLSIRLDHGAAGEEYEEVIEFHPGSQSRARIILWRNAEAVFVQPLPGRRQRYGSVQAALADLLASSQRRMSVSDIVATTEAAG